MHIKEIIKSLPKEAEGFLEIRFDDPSGKKSGVIDKAFQNKVITVDCPYGTVTILFDDEGQLKSIEIC